ncbi:malate dehydrogenase (quinone) [Luteimonas terrae]|uniref:Probable malate:quinone oxidoreductase n=1 Tax=Luteimonas terrae TaxID=1530191 RepID=A0ABU1XSC3_9GAMM|nr:malate dehydrogenase (quinone) [Luteimonas terrae]MDR7191670.1 malate dehydrogenase (quinone) [Luteimonas terrae]
MKKFLKALVGLVVLVAIAAGLFLYWPLFERAPPEPENAEPVDVVLIGAGVMSVTLATYLQELEPDWRIEMYERLDGVSLESSDGWNNAGTGHSGFAELNYTPEREDGSIETARAVDIAEQFEISRQFWSHQVEAGRLGTPGEFINATPHMSFVWGDANIDYLRRRHAALAKEPLFNGMVYSEDPQQIAAWAPLMMQGRDPAQKIAATWMPLGTDVNFGVITRQLTQALERSPNFGLHLRHEVRKLQREDDGTWIVAVHDLATDTTRSIRTKFVFVGAGGAALTMLQHSGIPEAANYGGFPVGGQFLAADNPAVTARHEVKAYGKAEEGSPPMSVPHLDARMLDGKPVLLFGPFALQSTRFLKHGSWFDLFSSVNNHNVAGMMRVGAENRDLVGYLISQARLSDADRMAELQKYYPGAQPADWRLVTAGQRVQVIKRDPEQGAILQFGTEIVTDADGSIAALLGASPGASTSPKIMLDVMRKVYPTQMEGPWRERIEQIVPSFGQTLNTDVALTNRIRGMTSRVLQLPYHEVPGAAVGDGQPPAANDELHGPDEGPDEVDLDRRTQAL